MLRKRAKYYCWKGMKHSVLYTAGSLSFCGLTSKETSRFLTVLKELGYVRSKKVFLKQGCITMWKKVKDVSFNEILEKLRVRTSDKTESFDHFSVERTQ